jgi:hypothetical protein
LCPGAPEEDPRRELQGPKHRFLRPFFSFTPNPHGFNWKITVIVVSTSTGSPFNMVGR